MNISRRTVLAVCGIAVGLGGCALGMDDEEALGISTWAVTDEEGGGGYAGKPNGADPDKYWTYQQQIDDALASPLYVNSELNSDAEALLENEPESLFKYLARCALPGNVTVAYEDKAYEGGVEHTDANWLTTGLSDAERENVHSCMAAYLNPNWSIPLLLDGPLVSAGGTAEEKAPFNQIEASFVAKYDPRGTLELHAWPLDVYWGEFGSCGELIYNEMKFRLCGTKAGEPSCHVNVHLTGFDDDCSGSNATRVCLGKPAVTTFVRSAEPTIPWCIQPQ